MKKHVTITVSGKVQGVFFRASTKHKADELDVKGLVRNEPEGSVYIEAEGEEENIEQFIRWCERGPASARVDQCDVNEAALTGYHHFIILR